MVLYFLFLFLFFIYNFLFFIFYFIFLFFIFCFIFNFYVSGGGADISRIFEPYSVEMPGVVLISLQTGK